MITLWTVKQKDNTIRSIWPAHDLLILMKDGRTVGGTKEELDAGTGAAASLARGEEWTYQDCAYISAIFPELLEPDQAEAVVIDGKEYPLK